MFAAIVFFVFVNCFVASVVPSAIPMWEFLNRQEKTSYLYSVYANQVDEYCESSNLKDCNQELLRYGLERLRKMSEDTLDFLDPYQRDANNLIWNAILQGHPVQNEPKRTTTTSKPTKPNSYEGDFYITSSESYPLLVRVYPDGRPVPESSPLPEDEDLKQYKLSQVILPSS